MTSNQKVRLLMLVSLIVVVTVVGCGDSSNPVRSSGTPGQMDSSWELLAPLPTEAGLYDVAFCSRDRAFACGDQGTLLETRDAGATWNKIELGTRESLLDVEFLDSKTGFISGRSGFLATTHDGGRTWRTISKAPDGWINLLSIVSLQEIWAVLNYSQLVVSHDGGESWEVKLNTPFYEINGMMFLEDGRGWVTGEYSVFHTDDFGETWENVTNRMGGGSYGFWYSTISRTPEGLIVISAGGYVGAGYESALLVSRDGGATWSKQLLPSSLSRLQWMSRDEVIAIGSGNAVYRSVDGGLSWSLRLKREGDYLRGIDAARGNAIAVGPHGGIFYSHDNGENWTSKTTGSSAAIFELHMVDDRHGFAVRETGLEQTLNGGETWSIVGPAATEMFWLDQERAWISDESGNIYRTTDRGQSWFPGRQFTQWHLYDIDFVDSLNGWNVGYPAAMRTRDAGLTWTVVKVPGSGRDMYGVDFIDSLTGWVCGSDGLILKCTDGAFSWIEQQSGSPATLRDILFLDSLSGWCVGERGTILKTIDGGDTWEHLPFLSIQTFQKIRFYNQQFGLIIGGAGSVFTTRDGGETWEETFLPTGAMLQSLFIMSDEQIWVGGSGGTLYRTELR